MNQDSALPGSGPDESATEIINPKQLYKQF